MKKTTNTDIHNSEESSQLSDSQTNEMESDPLWSLIEKADSPTEVNPLFAINVMREIRLLDENKENSEPLSIWQTMFSTNFAKYGLGLAAACAILITVISTSNTENLADTNTIDSDFLQDIPLESLSEYSENVEISVTEDAFTAEILELVDQDPLFLSEEDIDLAMNF